MVKAYIWFTNIEVRHSESYINGVGVVCRGIQEARAMLESTFPEYLDRAPDLIHAAAGSYVGQRIEFSARLVEPVNKALVVSSV